MSDKQYINQIQELKQRNEELEEEARIIKKELKRLGLE